MNQTYVLDRTDRELDRLDLQGIICRDATRRATQSGVGNVTFESCREDNVDRWAVHRLGRGEQGAAAFFISPSEVKKENEECQDT